MSRKITPWQGREAMAQTEKNVSFKAVFVSMIS